MILLFSYLSQLKPKNQSTISAISSLFSRYFSQLFQAGHVDSSHDFLCDLKPVADIARAPAWRSSSVKLLFSWKKTIRSQHTLGLRTLGLWRSLKIFYSDLSGHSKEAKAPLLGGPPKQGPLRNFSPPLDQSEAGPLSQFIWHTWCTGRNYLFILRHAQIRVVPYRLWRFCTPLSKAKAKQDWISITIILSVTHLDLHSYHIIYIIIIIAIIITIIIYL